jgi:hypothetical protein
VEGPQNVGRCKLCVNYEHCGNGITLRKVTDSITGLMWVLGF